MYTVQLHAYGGLIWYPDGYGDKGDARFEIARLLRLARRKGYPITTLKRGAEWEIAERDDGMMVPDDCGILTLRETYRYRCRECGRGHDDRDDLSACCTDDIDTGEG